MNVQYGKTVFKERSKAIYYEEQHVRANQQDEVLTAKI
jgi:hypothetical protein